LLFSFENWPLFLVHPQNLFPTFRSISTHLLIQCMSRHHPKVLVVLTSFDLFYLGNIKSFKMYARNFTRNRKKTTQSGEKTKTFGWCLDMH
jgi:hypothetical protein